MLSRFAYRSTLETGRAEIFVAPFEGAGGKYQVSTNSGFYPRWRRDGSELFFMTPNGDIYAVPVNTRAAGFEFGAPHRLFASGARTGYGFPFDVTADGQRFLVSRGADQVSAAPITVVMNWVETLTR